MHINRLEQLKIRPSGNTGLPTDAREPTSAENYTKYPCHTSHRPRVYLAIWIQSDLFQFLMELQFTGVFLVD